MIFIIKGSFNYSTFLAYYYKRNFYCKIFGIMKFLVFIIFLAGNILNNLYELTFIIFIKTNKYFTLFYKKILKN
jgi:hypothetical protein